MRKTIQYTLPNIEDMLVNIQHRLHADNQKETFASMTIRMCSTGFLSLSSAHVSLKLQCSAFEKKSMCIGVVYIESVMELVL